MSLELKNIHKAFGKSIIFKNLDFDFSHCGFYLITGKSGCGKTTLLNILAGYENIDSGERCIDSDISIACIFQSYELIDELTVQENILMTHNEEESCIDILKQLDIEDLLNRYPKELSQGQRQRVGIARALYCQPQMIICDEPTESLDIENKEKVLNLLKTLSYDHIIIVASHETTLLQKYYDYHYEIENHQLSLISQYSQNKVIEKRKNHYQIHSQKIKQIIHKIIHKRTLYQTIFMSICIIMQMIMFQIGTNIFAESTNHIAVNKNSIYVKTYNQNPDILNKYSHSKRPILEFGSIPIKNKLFKINIYPQSTDDNISHVQLKQNEILINQNVANILKEQFNLSDSKLIYYKLDLAYQLGQGQYTIPFEIVGVVEEDVDDIKQIYYSYEGINNILKQKQFSTEFPTQYDYLMKNNAYFELQCGDQVEKSYQSLQKQNGLTIQHCIFSKQQDNLGQKSLYQFMFITVQVILGVITMIYILYITWKETKRNLTSLSLLHAVGVPISQVKKIYFIEKLKYLIVIIPFLLLGLIIHSLFFNQDINYLLILGYILMCYAWYIIILFIKMMNFHQKNISIILKEDKDGQ